MENIERKPRSTYDNVKGSHADICVVNPQEWEELLTEVGGHKHFAFTKRNKLPAPINHANLNFWAPASDAEAGETLELNAEIDFNPGEIPHNPETFWQSVIIDRINDSLKDDNFETHQLPHEVGHLYARVSPEHLAHIKTTTEPDRCIVSVCLMSTSTLEYVREISDDTSLPNNAYDIFKSCLNVWSHTFDAVADSYGMPRNDQSRQKSRLRLRLANARPDHTTSPQIPDPIDNIHHGTEHFNEEGVHFRDIAGYDDIKNRLRELAIQQKYPDIARNMQLSKTQGILLYGVPGTAKTMLLKAFANEINAELVSISVSEIAEKWVGASARNLDSLFESLIQRTDTIVVLMDEFDSIAIANDEASSNERIDSTNRLKEWVTQITEKHHNIILTAATNNIHLIDPAVVRPERFLRLEVPAPNEQMRREIWSLMIGKLAIHAAKVRIEKPDAPVLDIEDDIQVDELAEQSEGMVGAHFSAILDAIKRQRLREYDTTGKLRPISQTDLVNEIEIAKDQD